MSNQDQNQLGTEIPEAAKVITLSQALDLVPKLAGQTTVRSYVDRLRIHDPIIRVFALTELVKSANDGAFNDDVLTIALQVAQNSSYLRQLLTPMLIKLIRFDLVDRIIALEHQAALEHQQLPERLMIAQKNNDFELQVELLEQLYLQTGDPLHIGEASYIARERLPWQKAWKQLMRMFFMQSEQVESSLLFGLQLFEQEKAHKEFEILGRIICTRDPNRITCTYATAQMLYWSKDYKKCLDFMQSSKVLEITELETPVFTNLAARCAEALQDYRQAASWYEKQNLASVDERYAPGKFIKDLDERAALPVAPLPVDTHSNYFIMTGFSRSGTTLLENTLNAHPEIATCEETSSLLISLKTAYNSPIEKDPERKNISLRAYLHRELYYQNLNRWVTKSDAKVVIDKTPVLSADIRYLEKLFPAKRYIFSIRHPYDVVLSNWKQTYGQNIAMAAFNEIHDACIFYDYVMSHWFEVFPGKTERVHYVRYDELVTDFRRVVEDTLIFLGVEWADEVLNFVEHSAQRPVRTPSYANVRQGLTLGVQTSWQNFEFLFDDRCRELLDPWVNHFGYDQ